MPGPVVFIHIPKTGGSTFASILRRNFPTSDVVLPNALKQEPGLDERLTWIAQHPERVRSIHGHVPLSYRDRFPADARFVTLLRDPVRRQYSHYLWIYGKKVAAGTAPSVGEALMQGRLIDNLQTRMLSGLDEPLTRPADDALLAAARAELDGFAVAGLVERFPESMLLAQERLGLRHVAYRRRNVRRSSQEPDDVEALRNHNRLDLELYAYAHARIEPELERLQARGAKLARADEAMTKRRLVADPVVLGYVADYWRSAVGARVQRALSR